MKHDLFLTMTEDKVASIFTDKPSSSICRICRATPRQMDGLTKVSAGPENEDSYQYELSTVHA